MKDYELKKKIKFSIIPIIILIIMTLGVTFAFFSYTITGDTTYTGGLV